jgi:uncharacterized repeat protein (TIGR01451 family)
VSVCGRSQRGGRERGRTVGLFAILIVGLAAVSVLLVPVARAAAPTLLLKENADVRYTPAGPRITYDITLANQGIVPLSGVVVSDTLPTGASLLYFANAEAGKWLSTQRDTSEGRVALWLNQDSLSVGQSVTLTYVVQFTWKEAPSGKIEKRTAIARADGAVAVPAQDTVTVVMSEPTPTQPSSPTVSPTTSSPTATAMSVPPSATTISQLQSPVQKLDLTNVPTREVTAASAASATPNTSPAANGSPALYIIVLIGIVAAGIVLWVATKQR